MSTNSKIEWTDATWNPIVGCSLVSQGCKNCYAMKEARRLGGNATTPQYKGLTKIEGGRPVWTGEVRLVESALDLPLRRRKPTRFFVNSMSDLFHPEVKDEWIRLIFRIMQDAPQHIFQILTKRPERMKEWQSLGHHSLKHVWPGVSVENQAAAKERIPLLHETLSLGVRWLSIEPLLGPVDVAREVPCGSKKDMGCIGWVVVGGESGPGARPMHPEWARSLRDQCQAAAVPFFFKQWGEYADLTNEPDGSALLKKSTCAEIFTADEKMLGCGVGARGMLEPGWKERGGAWMGRIGKKSAGRLLDGREWNEYPERP